jgi:hypothetical protein
MICNPLTNVSIKRSQILLNPKADVSNPKKGKTRALLMLHIILYDWIFCSRESLALP